MTANFVTNDGAGNIWTGQPGNWTLFRYIGWDASFCWNGAALIFTNADPAHTGSTQDRTDIFVANIDGSGLYNTGIGLTGAANILASFPAGCYFTMPQLARDNSIYGVSVLNPSTGGQTFYTYGANGSSPTWRIQNAVTPGILSYNGDAVCCGGWNGTNFRIFYVRLSDYNVHWCYHPITDPNYQDAWYPSLSIQGRYAMAVMVGNFQYPTPLALKNPATYTYSDIAMLDDVGGSMQLMGLGEPFSKEVCRPSLSQDGSVVQYLRLSASGDDSRAQQLPAPNLNNFPLITDSFGYHQLLHSYGANAVWQP